jgi:hypothetical protein
VILTGQGTAGTAGTLLVSVPPGPSATILVGGLLGSWYGAGSTVTVSNGAALPAGAVVTIPGFASSKGTTLYVAATASTVISYTISTDL